MPDRILLIQLRRIGDVLMTTPSLAALRRTYPRAHISFLTEAPSDQIFRHNPHVDEVLVYPRGGSLLSQWAALRRLRGGGFDLVVDFFGNPRSTLLTRLTGARRRIGLDFAWRRWGYTETLWPKGEGKPYAAQHKAALLEPLGIEVSDFMPRIFLSGRERRFAGEQLQALGVREEDLLVAVSPVSRQPYKVWPPDRYARLADVLIERYGAKVMLVWGPGEESFANAVRMAMRQRALPDHSMPDLVQLAALLERAHLYVGNDNGPRHFAVAVGTPTVTVFGRPFPENWTPPGHPEHRTVQFDPGCKRECTYPRCGHLDCINAVPYDAVQAEMESLLEVVLRDGKPH